LGELEFRQDRRLMLKKSFVPGRALTSPAIFTDAIVAMTLAGAVVERSPIRPLPPSCVPATMQLRMKSPPMLTLPMPESKLPAVGDRLRSGDDVGESHAAFHRTRAMAVALPVPAASMTRAAWASPGYSDGNRASSCARDVPEWVKPLPLVS